MKRIHALLIALAVSFAVVAGTFAAIRTTQLGSAASPSVSPTEVARQTKILDQTKAQLKRALNKRPPKLPPLPSTTLASKQTPTIVAPTSTPQPNAAPPATTTYRVIHVTQQPSGTTVITAVPTTATAPKPAPTTTVAPTIVSTAVKTPTTHTSSSATTSGSGESEGHENDSATTESHEHEGGNGGGADD